MTHVYRVCIEDPVLREMFSALLAREKHLPPGVCVYESGRPRPECKYPIVLCGAEDEMPRDIFEDTHIIRRPVSVKEVLRVIADLTDSSGAGRGVQEGILFDTESRSVSFGGDSVVLTPREAELFNILYRHRGHPVSRDEIRRELWPEGRSNAPDVYINYLRRRLRPLLGEGAIISLSREGYMLSDKMLQ